MASGFLLAGTFVVLRSKTGPRAEMLGGWEQHGHIHISNNILTQNYANNFIFASSICRLTSSNPVPP